MLIIGCSENKAEQNNQVISNENTEHDGEVDIFDFYFINRAPIATEKHPLDELIKIYLSSKGVAIDVKNNELYEKPRFSTNGVATFEDPLQFHDKEGLLEILETYHVQEWKEDYTTEDPGTYQDGFGWLMILQFEDGTVEKYRGSGPFKEDVVPENFDEFANDIAEFKNEIINEST